MDANLQALGDARELDLFCLVLLFEQRLRQHLQLPAIAYAEFTITQQTSTDAFM